MTRWPARLFTKPRVGVLAILVAAAVYLDLEHTSSRLWGSNAAPGSDLLYTYLLLAPVAWSFSLIVGLARRRHWRTARGVPLLSLAFTSGWAVQVAWLMVFATEFRTHDPTPRGVAYLDMTYAASVLVIGWIMACPTSLTRPDP